MSEVESGEMTVRDMLADMRQRLSQVGAELDAVIDVTGGGGLSLPRSAGDAIFVTPTKSAVTAVPRSRDLADDAQGSAGALGEILSAAAAHAPAADRGSAVQQALLDFGAWVRQRRDARGWTLEQLAGKIGSTPAQISLVERGLGKRGPSLALIARILWAFDLELSFPPD